MKSSAKKVELASVDDLFSTEEIRADAQREKVLEIPLSELHPFKDHPFKVKDDEAMMENPGRLRRVDKITPITINLDRKAGPTPSGRRFWKFPCRSCTRSRITPSRSRMTRP